MCLTLGGLVPSDWSASSLLFMKKCQNLYPEREETNLVTNLPKFMHISRSWFFNLGIPNQTPFSNACPFTLHMHPISTLVSFVIPPPPLPSFLPSLTFWSNPPILKVSTTSYPGALKRNLEQDKANGINTYWRRWNTDVPISFSFLSSAHHVVGPFSLTSHIHS